MTTNFSTIRFALSKFYCRGVSHENKKNSAVLDDFPLCRQGPPPSKSENYIFIVVSPSLSIFEDVRVLEFLFWLLGGDLGLRGFRGPRARGVFESKRSKIRTPQTRRRTNVQQLTCKINLPFSFYYLFLSFVLLELKPFVLKGKVLGEKL